MRRQVAQISRAWRESQEASTVSDEAGLAAGGRARPIPVRRLLSLLQLLIIVGAFAVSWPTSLGGQVSYVQVSGQSMYPTYHDGDLVVTRQRGTYEVGDSVVYRVPKGDVAAGAQVVHRIIAGNGREGFVLQGDNNEYKDLWRPRHGDVVGRVSLHIPNAGNWVAFVARPLNLGILCGSLTIMTMLWPRRRGTGDRRDTGDRRVGDRRGAQRRLPEVGVGQTSVQAVFPREREVPQQRSEEAAGAIETTSPATFGDGEPSIPAQTLIAPRALRG